MRDRARPGKRGGGDGLVECPVVRLQRAERDRVKVLHLKASSYSTVEPDHPAERRTGAKSQSWANITRLHLDEEGRMKRDAPVREASVGMRQTLREREQQAPTQLEAQNKGSGSAVGTSCV